MRPLGLVFVLLPVALLGCNDIPEGTGVAIEPESPTTTEDLTVTIVTPATDKDPVSYSYAWSRNGQPVGEQTSDVVPSSATTKNEIWTVVVTPSDGKVEGPTAEATVSIVNTAPTATVSLTPTEPTTLSELQAQVTPSDVDGDAVTIDWVWTVDGVAMDLDQDSVSADRTEKGQVWEVTATPTDGAAAGEPVSASVTIANEPPVADSVSLTPTEAFVNSTLTATPVGSDPDAADTLTWTYTWYVDGSVVTGSEASLAGAWAKGSSVLVEAAVGDGTDTSATVRSEAITIANTPPVLGGARVEPGAPTVADTLVCTAVEPFDADGDAITYSTAWTVDGRAAGAGETLSAPAFSKGQAVLCTLTPDDGEAAGEPVISEAIIIVNTPPVLGGAAIRPDPARTGDALSAELSGAGDADGDEVGFTYLWEVEGTAVATSATLASGSARKGERVDVTVTPNDGEDDGTPVTDTLTISNTAPTAPAVLVDPSDPASTDDLLCEIDTPSTDADRDSLTYSVTWTRDGSTWSGATSTTTHSGDTIDASNTRDGERWSCSMTAFDGTDRSPAGVSPAVTVRDRDGQVRTVSGTWVDVYYERCGTGTSCTAAQAKSACTSKGMKVVSHASNGTSSTYSLGATSSCQWSISYFTTDTTRASGECLVGVSNLDWSSCCTLSNWHGNTVPFGTAGSVFGYVSSGNSGYVSSYTNTSGRTWGCVSTGTAASVQSGCSSLWVACVE